MRWRPEETRNRAAAGRSVRPSSWSNDGEAGRAAGAPRFRRFIAAMIGSEAIKNGRCPRECAERHPAKIYRSVAWFTSEHGISEYCLVRGAVPNEVLMKRFPSKLSADDLRTYRRRTGGLYLSYLAAIIVAVALTFTNWPASELKASNEIQMARLKGSSASIDGPAADQARRQAVIPAAPTTQITFIFLEITR